MSDLDFFRERAQLEAGKLALRAAEISVRQSREELNVLMGLWGAQTQWQSAGRLPDIPEQPLDTKDIERLSLERSLELAQARQAHHWRGRTVGIDQVDDTAAGIQRRTRQANETMEHGKSGQN